MRTKFALEAEGKLFANALEIITDVPEEPTCLLSCKKNPDCKFFTHYSSLDVNYPGLCVLQKELSGPLTVCEHCRTGSSDCSDITDSSCSFVVGSDKTPVSSFMFTDSATATVTISTLAQLLCELNVVAVGGGGSSGGGSGHVSNLNVPVPFPRLIIRVGGPGIESTFGTPGQLLLSASPGKDGGKQGGDGYSGGGGAKENGGEDGGDAPDQNSDTKILCTLIGRKIMLHNFITLMYLLGFSYSSSHTKIQKRNALKDLFQSIVYIYF